MTRREKGENILMWIPYTTLFSLIFIQFNVLESSLFEIIHFMIQIKYYKSKSVFNITLFKILNDITLCTISLPKNKILTI